MSDELQEDPLVKARKLISEPEDPLELERDYWLPERTKTGFNTFMKNVRNLFGDEVELE